MQQRVLVPGDVVWIRQRRWRVERSRQQGDVTHVDVLGDRGRATFLAPFDRVVAPTRHTRLRAVSAANAVRRFAALLSATASGRAPASAIDADVRLWPFQLEPALAVIEGARRILIADEVGLGKTIQAGLAIAEICRRRPSARVLVVVPAGLAAQWIAELAHRFAIPSIAVDAQHLDRLSREGRRDDNLWQRRGVWIASIDYLKQPQVIGGLPHDPWDLVVFDEAHMLCGDSKRYEAAHAIAARARAMVMLTATPHGGDHLRFERLLALGEIRRDAQDLVALRRTRADLGMVQTRRIRWLSVAPTAAERDVLDALNQYERAAMRASKPVVAGDVPEAVLLLLAMFRKRALSSMRALDISLRRRLAWLDRASGASAPDWRQIDLFDSEPDSDLLSRDDMRGLTGDIGLAPAHERAWLGRLIRLTDTALVAESKMASLRTLLRRTTEPVVIFTEFRHTLEALQKELGEVRQLVSLHGGQTPTEQHATLNEFLGGRATALLATDVASQGLNMQSRSRWVICFDLPWTPARLEQRVGRVDRLGQQRTVHATMVIRRHSAEARVLIRIANRVLVADAAAGGLAFSGWNINEDLVRRGVIVGDPVPLLTAPSFRQLPISHTWSRAARAATRHLERRRQFKSRGPWQIEAASYAFVSHLDRIPNLSRLSIGHVGVYVAPLLDRTGDVVEQHPIAIDFGRSRVDRESLRANHESIDRLVVASLQARRRRLTRWLRRRAERLALTERLLQAAGAAATLSQVGLFDRREAMTASARREELTELDRMADERVDETFATSVIDIGSPVLELLFARRA